MLSRFVIVFFFQQVFIPSQRPAHPSPAQCLLPEGLPHTERGGGNHPAAALSPALGVRMLSHSIWAAATKTPQTGGLKTLLPVLESGTSEVKMWADSASAEGLLLAILLLCPQVIRGMGECSRVFSIRTLVPSTSQSPYFLILTRWRWGLQDVDLEGHKHSVYCRCCDKLPFSKECTAESYESYQLFLLNAAFPKRAEKKQEQDEKHREKKEKNRKIYGSLSLAWDPEWCSVSTLPSLPPCLTHTHTHTHTRTCTCTHTQTHTCTHIHTHSAPQLLLH